MNQREMSKRVAFQNRRVVIFDEFDEQTRNGMFSTIEAASTEESLIRQMDVNSKKVCKSQKRTIVHCLLKIQYTEMKIMLKRK